MSGLFYVFLHEHLKVESGIRLACISLLLLEKGGKSKVIQDLFGIITNL